MSSPKKRVAGHRTEFDQRAVNTAGEKCVTTMTPQAAMRQASLRGQVSTRPRWPDAHAEIADIVRRVERNRQERAPNDEAPPQVCPEGTEANSPATLVQGVECHKQPFRHEGTMFDQRVTFEAEFQEFLHRHEIENDPKHVLETEHVG